MRLTGLCPKYIAMPYWCVQVFSSFSCHPTVLQSGDSPAYVRQRRPAKVALLYLPDCSPAVSQSVRALKSPLRSERASALFSTVRLLSSILSISACVQVTRSLQMRVFTHHSSSRGGPYGDEVEVLP